MIYDGIDFSDEPKYVYDTYREIRVGLHYRTYVRRVCLGKDDDQFPKKLGKIALHLQRKYAAQEKTLGFFYIGATHTESADFHMEWAINCVQNEDEIFETDFCAQKEWFLMKMDFIDGRMKSIFRNDLSVIFSDVNLDQNDIEKIKEGMRLYNAGTVLIIISSG